MARDTGPAGTIGANPVDVAARLRGIGQRVTPQRMLILGAFEPGVHLSADEVYASVERLAPAVNRSTVYRTLELFRDLGLITEKEWAFDFSFPEEGGDPNPHLWVNVPYAMRYAELTAGWLSERDPANADCYRTNHERYLAVLTRLDAGIMAAVQTVPAENRRLLTYHDSYAYFARHYGMTVIGAVQPSDFSEPSPQEVADLIDQIREEQVPAVFGSEVFPSPVLEQIAEESGATYVDQLRDDDPPGEPGSPEHTYVGMMLKNMELMIPALGGNVDALADIEPWDTYV